MDMFYPLGHGGTGFEIPVQRKLRIEGCTTQ
jgi:hypothetical protein